MLFSPRAARHNPQTHDFAGGYEITLEKLLESIEQTKLIQGVTFSGGEPFAQAKACAKLARQIKQHGLNIVTYSGHYHDELLKMAKADDGIAELLEATDILIDGPYDESKQNLKLPFRGSDNQSIIYLAKK
jgi:anaerobic ribonucleoside-triphosphate reductase activating protein